jgi:hypothetical protein
MRPMSRRDRLGELRPMAIHRSRPRGQGASVHAVRKVRRASLASLDVGSVTNGHSSPVRHVG